MSYGYILILTPILILISVDDTLESVLAASDEEEESEAIVTQVLDEIGIDINSKVCCIVIPCYVPSCIHMVTCYVPHV